MSERIVVEVRADEATALDRLVHGIGSIARRNNPLDRLLIRIADAEGMARDPYQRCEACKGRGWIENDD